MFYKVIYLTEDNEKKTVVVEAETPGQAASEAIYAAYDCDEILKISEL